MEQPDLFQELTARIQFDQARAARRRRPGVITDTPRARAVDPETSHQAAAKIKTSGRLSAQQRQALELVRLHPGCTTWELAMHIAYGTGTTPELQERWISRRLPELVDVGVRKGEPKVVKGRKATTWWPSDRLR